MSDDPTHSELWSKPEIAPGDDNRGATFQAVGSAITQWEKLEFEWSVLFSIFQGRPHIVKTIQEYGRQGRIFEERMQALERAAEAYFCQAPHQERHSRQAGLGEPEISSATPSNRPRDRQPRPFSP